MVIEKNILFDLLSQNKSVQEYAGALQKTIDTYPYFQAAHVLQTKFLKEHKLFYQNNLQQTAARTIDRAVLFEHIERNKPESKTSSDSEQKTALQKETIQQKTDFNSGTNPTETEKHKTDLETLKVEKSKKKNYLSWLQEMKPVKNKNNDEIFDVIDKFLKDRPKIVPKRDSVLKTPVIVEKSVEERQMLMTETLANLYVKQKKYDKAIQAFRILSLKYPKKSSYFANQIKEIKQKIK